MGDKKTTLYIIQGFIGAGKTTFSRKLALETDAIHLNPDEWVSKLYSKEEYMKNWNMCFDETVNLLWNKTTEYLLSGHDVIFDMGFWYKKDRNFARTLANECKANFKHYYLYVSDDILKERIVSDRPKHWAKIHLENFDQNKQNFEEPEEDESPIIVNNF